MGKVLMSEIRKNKRSKALAISAALIVGYEAVIVFYTVSAVGLFDNFMYLYKFSLSYMNFLILPMILLSFITAVFSNDYKSDTIKYLWMIPVSKKRFFFSKALYVLLLACLFMGTVFVITCAAGYFSRFRSGMTAALIVRFLLLCALSALLVTLAMLPVSLITIFTKGNALITNLAGSIYVIASFLSMKYLQGISPLSSVPHIIWYKNFEGVQNNPRIGLLLINVIAVFILSVIASLIVLEKQEL